MSIVPFPQSPLERAEVRRRADDRVAPFRELACTRHGCGHVGADHRGVFAECRECGCPALLDEGTCDRGAVIIATSSSGLRYERCRCGAARTIPPGADSAPWVWPDDVHAYIAETFDEDA